MMPPAKQANISSGAATSPINISQAITMLLEPNQSYTSPWKQLIMPMMP
jgi:hypothetical protein